MKGLHTIRLALGLVYEKKRNLLWTGLISILALYIFISVNYLSDLKSVLDVTGSYSLVLQSSINHFFDFSQAETVKFVAAVLIALLAGVAVTMTAFRFRNAKSAEGKGGMAGILGIFSGALAASCPACSLALISLLGVSGGLAIFPLGGVEFSFLALGLLLFSIAMISKSLVECEECSIKL